MTKFERFCGFFTLAVVVILIAGFSWKIGGKHGYSAGYSDALASITPDTIIIDNTIHYDKPVPDTIFRDTRRVVYVQVPVTDSTGHVDTTAVALHPEVRQFADPERAVYELQISGIEPQLDWITVHQHTEYINVPVPQPKYPSLILSPAVGGYVLPGGFGIAGGLELDYWRGRWQLSAGAGYGLNSDLQQITPGWQFRACVKYNLLRK